jgi:hypothetical protein
MIPRRQCLDCPMTLFRPKALRCHACGVKHRNAAAARSHAKVRESPVDLPAHVIEAKLARLEAERKSRRMGW